MSKYGAITVGYPAPATGGEGYLFINESGKLKSRHTVAGVGRIYLYAVKFEFMEAEV